jgi:selenocysteine lyase/cysteine desulfurase
VVLGPSTTALTHLLANAYGDLAASDTPPPADRREIIVSTAGHEANVWPWMRLAARGYTIRAWDIALDSAGRPVPDMAALDALLSSRTLLVAFPHVSNILGDVWDARAICAKARAAGASTVVDGVALAPHRLPDVADIGCDFYVYSTYKVFGPHAAALFGTADAFAPLTGPNHPFIPKSALPGKFELGGFNHESAAAIVATHTYFRFLAGLPESELQPSTPADRATLARAFAHAESLERATAAPLLSALTSSKAVRLWGRPAMDEHRVCTISFTFQGKRSADVARELNAQGLGVKHGHFYSRRLLESLGLDPEDGVVRVSLAHYNIPDEVQRLLAALAPHLG